MNALANIRAELAWWRAKPILKAVPPPMRRPLAYQLATKQQTAAFGSVVDRSWYESEGYQVLARALGSGYNSFTGVTITPDVAFECGAFYAGVKIIAEDMGRMPFDLFERSEDRKNVTEAIQHPVYPILRNLWNPEVSAGDGVEALTAHANITGNGYALKQRRRDGSLQWLFPLQPEHVRMERSEKKQLFYMIRMEPGLPEETHTTDDVFHLRGFTLDGVSGDDLLRRARQILGLSAAAQEHAGRWFKNDAAMGLIFVRPIEAEPLDDEALTNFKKQFKAWHQGLSKAGEPGVVQEGMKPERLMAEPEKTQLIEQRKFQVVEAARILRMKPHKLADLENAHLRNIAEENIDYISQTLGPWMDRWRRAVWRCLLTRDEQIADRLTARHNIQAFLEGDFEKQAKGFAMLLEKGVYSINEVRKWFRLNPVPGGDKHHIQLNMQAIADAATGAIQDQGSKLLHVDGREEEGYINGQGGINAGHSFPQHGDF